MRRTWKIAALGGVAALGVAYGAVTQAQTGLDTWKSGKNHNRIIQVQNEGGLRADTGKVEIAYFSHAAMRLTSPRGITVLVDPWRDDPSGAWGLWFRVKFPKAEVDIGMSTHAHFDHDAIGSLEASMLLDRMAGSYQLGDVKITGIADKHQCEAPGIVPWTDAVKQFEKRDNICPPTNYRHMDNTLYVIEMGGMRFLMWGDNRANPPKEVMDKIGKVDVIFLPVDGSKHILDYKQADAAIVATGAKIAIPYHYLVPSTTYVTSTLQPATEWAKTHPHTMLTAPSIELSKSDLKGKSGHVYYFGSQNMVKM